MKILGMTLPYQILTGIALGVVAGLFFGDLMSPLMPIGDGFILLLKMSILPYIFFALIHGIGSLQVSQAKRLLKYGAVFLVPIWIIVLGTMFAMTLSFPPQKEISHFAAQTTSGAIPGGVLRLFIPDNIFEALSNNIVPAVVVFSLFFGAALMVLKKKEAILDVLEAATNGLSRITRWVIQLSPIGVFALIGTTVGTVPWHQLEKLAVYLIAMAVASLFFVFWALPALVTSLTPVRYKELLSSLQPALLIGFSTGNIFVSLPYIMDGISAMGANHGIEPEETRVIGKTLTPIAYNLPLVGNLMAMFFILFLIYFYAYDFTFWAYLKLIPESILTLAGPVTAALNSIAFLIKEMGLPADGLRLFAETLAITRNFQAFAGVSGVAVFTLLTLFAFTKQLRFKLPKLLLNAGITLAILAATLTGLYFIQPSPPPLKPIWPSLTIASTVPTTLYRPGDKVPKREAKKEGETTLERIRRTNELWVGYNVPSLPFVYFNENNDLVGYDIAYAQNLAEALNVNLVLVPFAYYEEIPDYLEQDLFDIAMSGVSVNTKRLERMDFTVPTFVIDAVFVVLDTRREEFVSYEKVKQQTGLRIAAEKNSYFYQVAVEKFPNAEIVALENVDDFLNDPTIDALLWSSEEGLTWSLIHPAYTIVTQDPPIDRSFYAFGVGRGEPEFLNFVNYWMNMRKLDGFAKREHDKWILGETGKKSPHWSILRNVIGVGKGHRGERGEQ
ncbi:MAG: cation:dicarboxylase symporter family transporter [Parachlamydiales bacterium]